MAGPKYNPNDIAIGLIPKRWLDTPMISYNDAESEYQKLMNQTAVRDINESEASSKRRENESDEDIASGFQKKRDENIAGGGDGELTDEEMYDLVQEAQLRHGQGKGAVGTLLARQRLKNESDRIDLELKRKKLVTRNPYNDLYEQDAYGNESLVTKGKPKEEKAEKFRPTYVFNPATGEDRVVRSNDDLAIAYTDGFTDKFPVEEIARQKKKVQKQKAEEVDTPKKQQIIIYKKKSP